MKKLIVIVVCSFAVCASATEWSKCEHEGDALKGSSSYCSYSIGNKTGRVVFYDNGAEIKVIAGDYSFFNHKSKYIGGESFDYTIGTWGFYEGETLVKKGRCVIDVISDKPEHGYLFKRSNQEDPFNFDVLTIHNHLCKPGCSVRLIFPRYGESDFDVRIPYNSDFEKFNYIPSNIAKRKLEAEIKAKQKELERAEAEVARITAEKRKQYANMTNQLKGLQKRYDAAEKSDCPLSAKKRKSEIVELQKRIDKFIQLNKKNFPKAFE